MPDLDAFMHPRKEAQSRQPFSADLTLAGATASVPGTINRVWSPSHMDLRVFVRSDAPATTAKVLGVDLPACGKAGCWWLLNQACSSWRIHELKGEFGKSHIQGRATIITADTFRFEAEFDSTLLDVTSLIPMTDAQNDQPQPVSSRVQPSWSQSSEPVSADHSMPQWLTNLTGKISIDVQRLILPHAALKDVSVQAMLDDGLLRIAPLSIVLGGGTIKITAQLDLVKPSLARSLQATIQRIGLEEAMETFGRDAAEMGQISGRIALRLPAASQSTEDLFNADALLERLRIEDVRLRYDDLALAARTDLRLRADSVASGAQITGTVEIRDRPVDVSLSTGSLRQALDDYASLPVDATFQVNKTTIRVEGIVGKLFPLEKFNGKVGVEGPIWFVWTKPWESRCRIFRLTGYMPSFIANKVQAVHKSSISLTSKVLLATAMWRVRCG